MKHQKHNKLSKASLGDFGRNEWAFMGTNCHSIQTLASALAKASPNLKTAYVDADHKTADIESPKPLFHVEFTDKIDFQRVDLPTHISPWVQRLLFNDCAQIFVNGNHFKGARQIIFLDSRKFESLSRKTDRLTQVELFLTDPSDEAFKGLDDLPEIVRQSIPNFQDIPVLDVRDIPAIAHFIQSKTRPPDLSALLLTGGKSTRMGKDKAMMVYHQEAQWKHLKKLCHASGIADVFISCRAEQAADFEDAPQIHDCFSDLGPMGAILSAFRQQPDTAWLVLACDLPLLDVPSLQTLIQQRRSDLCATTFRQPDQPEFPEPLIAIWEPRSYPQLLLALGNGISCPRKVLINMPKWMIEAERPEALKNVNTPEEVKALG